MQILPAYHSILVSLATGALILAFLAIAFRFWFNHERWDFTRTSGHAFGLVGFYAAMFGLVMLVLTFISGWFLRHPEALLNSPIAKNKILVAVLSIVCWTGFIVIRIKAGPDLWAKHDLRGHVAFVLALAGVMFLVTTNSIGGDIGGIPSGYEVVGKALGFQTRHALYFPTWFNVLIVLAGIAAVVGAFRFRASSSSAHPT
jgi:hypothetical protein